MMLFILITLILSTAFCLDPNQYSQLLENVQGKRIGLLTNPTGVTQTLQMLADTLPNDCQTYQCKVQKFFSPEHGLRGDQQAGQQVADYIDEISGIKVVSLYGSKKAPSDEDLADIDILVYAIQDVGTRFYTFIWTLSYTLEALGRNKKSLVIVDYPNPLGDQVQGYKIIFSSNRCPNLLDAGLVGRLIPGKSFGVPHRYGMTIGEFALMLNDGLINKADVSVIKFTDTTNHVWIMPSPNMPTADTASVYPGFGIFEGTNLSEGRGTTRPFEIIGAPFIDNYAITQEFNSLKLEGVILRPLFFTPTFSKHQGLLCKGFQVHVLDKITFDPILSAYSLLKLIMKHHPQQIQFNPLLDLLTGQKQFAQLIDQNEPYQILNQCEDYLLQFMELRQKYRLY